MLKHTGYASGFTLIELLVTISIIAALASIMFPAFASAREKAHQVSCINNQRQLSLAIVMYAQDHDELFPDESTVWRDVNVDPRLLSCPTAKKGTPNCYVYSHYLSNNTMGQINNPTTFMMTGDGAHTPTSYMANTPPSVPSLIATYSNTYYSYYDLLFRHGQNDSVLESFIDGHVEMKHPMDKGEGLEAQYYCYQGSDDTRTNWTGYTQLAGMPVVQFDPDIDFDNYTPGISFPTPTGQQHAFCVRWIGYICPLYTDNYTIYIAADDGLRFFLVDVQNNNTLVKTELWQDQPEAEKYVPVTLQQGVRYPIEFDYYENDSGPAAARLRWASSLQAKQHIPCECLFPADDTWVNKFMALMVP